jgi:hypothetical protein
MAAASKVETARPEEKRKDHNPGGPWEKEKSEKLGSARPKAHKCTEQGWQET